MVAAGPRAARGSTIIEALVAVLLLTTGLLGLVGLHARSGAAQIEAYQRTQALALAQDMAERIALNKTQAARYVADDYGAGPVADCAGQFGVELDRCVWGNALRGAAERAAGLPVGTLTRGRGCVTGPDKGVYRIVVAWQSLAPAASPSTACGRESVADPRLLRAVVVPLRPADLRGTGT